MNKIDYTVQMTGKTMLNVVFDWLGNSSDLTVCQVQNH